MSLVTIFALLMSSMLIYATPLIFTSIGALRVLFWDLPQVWIASHHHNRSKNRLKRTKSAA